MDKPKITPEQIRNSVRNGLGLRDETLLWLADELEKRGAVGMSEERKVLQQEPIKYCPFCGETPMDVTRYEPHKHHFVTMPDYPGAWAVECVTCEYQIFDHESKANAIAKWNRRALLSAPAPEPVACPRCYGDGPHAECELCKGTGYTHQPASSWVRCDVITAYEYMKERNFPDIAACRVIEAAYKDVMQAPTEDKQ